MLLFITIFIPIPFLSYFAVHFITFDLIEFHEVAIFDTLVAIAKSAIPLISRRLPSGGRYFGEGSIDEYQIVLRRFHL